jgi:hypothetical protein
MQLHHLRRESPGAQAVPGNGAASQAMPVPGPARAGFAAPGMAVQACVMAGMLAGLWVGISPWFLSLQASGGNATANDLRYIYPRSGGQSASPQPRWPGPGRRFRARADW